MSSLFFPSSPSLPARETAAHFLELYISLFSLFFGEVLVLSQSWRRCACMGVWVCLCLRASLRGKGLLHVIAKKNENRAVVSPHKTKKIQANKKEHQTQHHAGRCRQIKSATHNLKKEGKKEEELQAESRRSFGLSRRQGRLFCHDHLQLHQGLAGRRTWPLWSALPSGSRRRSRLGPSSSPPCCWM